MRSRTFLSLGLLCLVWVAPASAAPVRGERTETPVASTAADRATVSLSHVRQYEPLPAALGAPAACDWITYLRYRATQGPKDPSRASAVFVSMPGLLGGALLFDGLARNVVASGARLGRHMEFWALDRRANCLEDHTGTDAAARAGDYRVALGYFYGGQEVDGRRFDGFKTSEQLPYLAEFGLAQTMRDEYALITGAIPDPAVRAKKLFCGGHSLGGSLTGAFASWDFDGDPETKGDAGYAQCAGFFGLDTTVSNNLGGGAKTVGAKGDAFYAAESQSIRSGVTPRLVGSIPPITPDVFGALSVAGVAAYTEPHGSTLLQELPRTGGVDTAVRMFLAKDTQAFATGRPDPRSYRLDNEALLGTIVDDNAQSIPALQVSVGTYDGGPVAEKDFPVPNLVRDIPVIGDQIARALPNTLIAPGASRTRLMIPATPGGPVYHWRDHDRVGALGAPIQTTALGKPFTQPSSEVTSLRDFARSLFESPVDAWEQYFPMRLLADDAAFLMGSRTGDLGSVLHEDGPQLRPYIELIGDEGVVNLSADSPLESGASPRRRVVLAGYNHGDVSTAAAKQNDGKPEAVATNLACFATEVITVARRVRPGRRAPAGASCGSPFRERLSGRRASSSREGGRG